MLCTVRNSFGPFYISAAADAEGRQVAATGGTGFTPPAPPADEAAPAGYSEEKEEPVHDMDTS